VRSNTRSVYIDDTDHTLIERHPEIDELATAIEQRRIELGKTSGFERLYARVTKLYFGGMAQHFADLRPHLRPGARLAYVVGDQASYLQVMIRTGQLLAKIADDLGYSVESIDLFRTRLATATKEQLREEVLILKWKGKSTMSPKKKIAGDASEGKANKYSEIIQLIFDRNYSENATEVSFSRDDIEEAANKLGMKIKNLGDVIYSFRYRTQLPISVTNKAPTGREWSIKPAGSAKYKFVAVTIGSSIISPRRELAITRIPDSTPSIINSYALNDEQALLAKLRYNRLIDTFTGTTCYSLQNHLRTQTAEMGQVETDEVYVGVDKRGAQYVYPVQAKGGTDKINLVQIEQDAAMCKSKFASLICKPIAAQFIEAGKIALFMFESDRFGEIKLIAERHYELTTDGIDVEELSNYASRPDQY
jgi:hypothetical protein